MQKESNQLVEEYMLLGNYLVAQQVHAPVRACARARAC